MSTSNNSFVALLGDIQIETSTQKLPADTNQSGSWQPGQLQEVTGQHIKVAGTDVLLSASMSWTYVGGTAGTAQIPSVTDSAQLTASPTQLKDGGSHILVNGDQAVGAVDGGNTITVMVSHSHLSTR